MEEEVVSENIKPSDSSRKRGTLHYLWAKAVKERDGYQCVKCGGEDRVSAHHIKSYKSNKKLRYDVTNGITLCFECHKLEHKSRNSKGYYNATGKRGSK